MVINTAIGAEKQQAAWEYIKFATGPEAQTVMVKNSGDLPVSETAVETSNFFSVTILKATRTRQCNFVR
ncbi:hypothetical protein E0J21_35645 [Rhizobium laguerreae]|nr:hypothetical protein E0J21_35645 [Rhizobium laguerreae]